MQIIVQKIDFKNIRKILNYFITKINIIFFMLAVVKKSFIYLKR